MDAPEPLIILSPGRSYSSVVTAMLGQHPQMYGLPETHLFLCRTIREWWLHFGSNVHSHGLLRAVAQIVTGRQTGLNIELARTWIWSRLNCQTNDVFAELSQQVYPRILIDKSPYAVHRIEQLKRFSKILPTSRFIHLTRHPSGYCRSVLNLFRELRPFFANPSALATVLNSWQSVFNGIVDRNAQPPLLDPQFEWYRQHSAILRFLAGIPSERQMRLHGEDVLSNPYYQLRRIAQWMGLRSDEPAVRQMTHPERSPFACFGPANAFGGGDPNFFRQPLLRPTKPYAQSLEGALSWRGDGIGFSPDVKRLARHLDYR